jgi:hypothetical protein
MCHILRTSLVLAGALAVAGVAHAQDDARALLERAIKARGGEERLAKIKAWQTKTKGTLELPMVGSTEFTGQAFVQPPNRSRVDIELSVMGQTVPVQVAYDGTSAWRSLMGNTMDISGPELKNMQASAYVQHIALLVPLKDKQYTLALLEEIKVEGKPAVGLKITARDRPEIKLFFDKESALLVRIERMVYDRQEDKEVPAETTFSDHKATDGVTFPMRSRVVRGGMKVEETQTLEIKFTDQLDPKLFQKP